MVFFSDFSLVLSLLDQLKVWQLCLIELLGLGLPELYNLIYPRLFTESEMQTFFKNLVSATFLLVCFLSLHESTCQTRKNAFYFTLKALFILEKIKF